MARERQPGSMDHGMILEAGVGTLADGSDAISTRLESIGWKIPERILTTRELMEGTRHHPHIQLERLTGIHQRHVCSDGEDSYTLAVGAARDCLAHSRYGGEDIEMLINCSISRYKGGLRHQWEAPLSLSIKDAIGANDAISFDISNACAGMMTGIFILHDFIRRGVIRRGMAVSGEYISSLGQNAAKGAERSARVPDSRRCRHSGDRRAGGERDGLHLGRGVYDAFRTQPPMPWRAQQGGAWRFDVHEGKDDLPGRYL